MKRRSLFVTVPVLLALLYSVPARAQQNQPNRRNQQNQSQAFTTIKTVVATPLSNGIQIRVTADGVLQYRNADTNGRIMRVTFPGARNGTGETFIRVDKYPVSYIQLSTPQSAQSGIGLEMQINNLVDTNGSITAAPDGQGVLLTILSDRTISSGGRGSGGGNAAAGGRDPDAAPDTSTEVRFENNLLSLRAVKADIHALIGAIAQKTALPITVDDAVDRKISLNLQNVEPLTAVQSIAGAYGLALARINGVVMISEGEPRDLATYRLSGTESYRMQNTQAGNTSELLPNFLYSYVRVNREQNAVVVSAPSQMLAKIGQDLNALDVPAPQIMVEAIAVEFSENADRDLGLSLLNEQSGSVTTLDTVAGQVTYNSIGKLPENFALTLRALETQGKARVRARPKMAVINGRTAEIFIGAQRFILVQFNSFGQTQTRIQPVDVGVKLEVTPLTGGNGEITTRLAPEVSNITELDLQTGLPVLSTRNAETTVRVRDGETIAIGGLTLNQEQTVNRKIPLLGDLPILGRLFRSQSKNEVRTELVIFVTPRILTAADTQQPAPEAAPAAPAPATP